MSFRRRWWRTSSRLTLLATVAGAIVVWLRRPRPHEVESPAAAPAPVDEFVEAGVDMESLAEVAEQEARTIAVVPPPAPIVAEAAAAYTALTHEVTEASNEAAPPKWVQPAGGGCPIDHPVKARFSTGRYHRPADRGYEKIVPDCCYATEQEAESDGFSRSRW